ncbi:MarR family winged helix-turn-helix transcriptional regulator [Paenibacillus mucilaginosus]|uniref:Transcriptional regulator n=3 Tax=Paenibacillus mucilaginosus TaxID=61624 RepID=I0BT44_9BACL|nr:MarR family transcriptional regulator [Paenibacillus mucilaginosus]AEI45527.1 putative transcriptional regulator [Paenibacillus mucilaginosus KNP414]AFC33225.1 putative transcriptional regulator [Paenibacillus mucilaginosus 3016]AFH65541.1 transcriptional regulator [Paenibacillus mucilaginosus K02]MCG7215282.1 MarR family transcriptional regulator [Paenibacillus mucilaginosus]WDM26947.1 MarR family transcriptional regulator [Paenibacillus mucilaginosus]
MDQLLELFLRNGLRPLSLFADTADLEKKVNRSELTALLLLLLRGELTMSELAVQLGAPLSTLTSLAKRLEKKGLIARRPSPVDQRITLVDLTPEGREMASRAKETMAAYLKRIEEVLTREETEQFFTLFLKIAKALQDGGGEQAVPEKPALRKISIEE